MKHIFVLTLTLVLGNVLYACPDCVEPEKMVKFNIDDFYFENCVEIEFDCSGLECPSGVLPYECFEGQELCIRYRFNNETWGCWWDNLYETLFGQSLKIQVGQLAEVNFLDIEEPPLGEWEEYCVPFEDIAGEGVISGDFAFEEESDAPNVKIYIGNHGIPTYFEIVPPGSYVLGDLQEEGLPGQVQADEPFMRICEGEVHSISSSSAFSITEGGNWSFNGSAGGGALSVGGSLGQSWSESYSYTYGESVTLPTVEAEDCAGIAPDCICCANINVVFHYDYSVYESIVYDCNGEIIEGGGENVYVVENTLNPSFIKTPLACPLDEDINPVKRYDGGGNQLMVSASTGSIIVEEELDFDFYTLEWTGPNGFSAVNETVLENLEFGTYCYTLTSCACEVPVDQGCVALCPDSTPVSGWSYDEEKMLYCREVSCIEAGAPIQECVDAVPCSEWMYDIESGECFQDICYGEEVLLINEVIPYDVSYDFDGAKCITTVYCEESGSELIIESDPEYSDAFFDESEESCLRYVICGGDEVDEEDVGIDDIDWEYDENEGCIGKIACNEGSSSDGEVSGGEVETELEDWEYDLDDDCFRDVTCSYNNDFEEELDEAAEGELDIEWDYNDSFDECLGQIECEGDDIDDVEDWPQFGDWDVYAALHDFECIREAVCGEGMEFEDTGDVDYYYETSDCWTEGEEQYQTCYVVVECNGEKVIDEGDEEYIIPCGGACPGGLTDDDISVLGSSAVTTECGMKFKLGSGTNQLYIQNHNLENGQIEFVAVINMSTGRVIDSQEILFSSSHFEHKVNLPSEGVYALAVYKKNGAVCSKKFFYH